MSGGGYLYYLLNTHHTIKTFLSSKQIKQLAHDLSGIAHILVEPCRNFSLQLTKLTNNKNAFGGYVGIYWAGGEGRNIILHNRTNREDLCSEIKHSIIHAVSNRRALSQCSKNYIDEQYQKSQKKEQEIYDDLLTVADDENEHLKRENECFRKETERLNEKLQEAELEINRLKRQLHESNQTVTQTESKISFKCTEDNFYPDEIKDIILETLKSSLPNCEALPRRKDIIDNILSNNPMTYKGQEILAEISKALSNRTSLNKWFVIKTDGKHNKLYPRKPDGYEDKRYLMTQSKSSSDKRAEKNWLSDLSKKMAIPKK